jgi:hypothetical protein
MIIQEDTNISSHFSTGTTTNYNLQSKILNNKEKNSAWRLLDVHVLHMTFSVNVLHMTFVVVVLVIIGFVLLCKSTFFFSFKNNKKLLFYFVFIRLSLLHHFLCSIHGTYIYSLILINLILNKSRLGLATF